MLDYEEKEKILIRNEAFYRRNIRVRIPKTERITKLVEHLYAKLPEIEPHRAVLLTESYRRTENEP